MAPSGRHSKIHGYLPYAWRRHQVDTARFMVTFLMPDGAIRWTQQDSWLLSLCLMAPSGGHSKIHGYLPYAWRRQGVIRWTQQDSWLPSLCLMAPSGRHSKNNGYMPEAPSGRHSKIHGYLPYAWWRHQVGTARFMVTFLMPDDQEGTIQVTFLMPDISTDSWLPSLCLMAPSGRHSKIHGYLPYAWRRHQVDTARFMVTFLMPDGAIR